MSTENNRAEVARRDHEDAPPPSISSQIGHFIKQKRAKRQTTFLHEAGYLLLGLVSLAAVTGLCFWLDVPLAAAAFTYLAVLVLFSLVSNFSSLTVLSLIGVCCLSYFFAPPIYSFRVDYPQDLITLSAFGITSFVVNFLVTRVRVENVERMRAEEDLRESEYRLRRIIETVPALLWSLAPDGEPTHFSPRLLDYFGKPFAYFKHGGWLAFVHPDDRAETKKAFSHGIQTGTSYQILNRLRRADGEFRWHVARGEPLRDGQGRIVQWYFVSVDIDEAKKAEDRLRRNEGYMAEAQRLSQSSTAVYNKTSILYWSEETYRLWGFDPLQGLPSREAVRQRVHPDDWDRVEKNTQRGVREKRGVTNEFKIMLPDGTVKHVEATQHPVFSASGEFEEIIGTAFDVTERKRAEERLRAQHTVALILAEAATIEEATPRLLLAMGECLGWDVGVLWRVDQKAEALRCVELWHSASIEVPEFERFSREFTFGPGLGLPGRVWSSLKPEYIADVVPDENFPRASIAEREGLRAAFGFPILLGAEVLGVIEFFSREIRQPDQELLNVLATIGSQIGQFIGRKRGEKALRESEAKIRRLVDANIIGIFIWDFDGRILEANEAFLDIVGYDSEELVAGNIRWTELTPPEWRDRDTRLIQEQKATGTLRPFEKEYFRKDGSRVPVLIGTATFEESGSQGVAFVIDLTERKRAEEALRRNEDWLAQAQRLSHTGSWVYSATTMRYLYWSDENYRIWGFDPLQGPPSREILWQRVHPDDRNLLWEQFHEALRQKKDFPAAYRIVLPDGTVKYLEATTHFEFSSLGALVETISTHVDVTEQQRAQEEHERLHQLESDLAHMNRLSMMGELAASLAHEIAQPIATARNNARAAMHFMDRSPPGLGQLREALACVVDDADRAGNILDRIRDHIKKAPPRKERVDLNQAINDVIALARDAIIENDISIQTHLTERLPDVQVDCVQLQQVVLNLILNAVEAMGSVGNGARELSISTEQHHAGGVLVAVRDSGPGIDPERLDRVFDAFYTTKSSGVGMGLSICRSIINAHGGRLWADVNASGGAVFQFTLPSAEEELTNPLPKADRIGAHHGGTVRDAPR
jgi:PAS domain S-box-containing protein